MKSYFTGRKQTVKIDEISSEDTVLCDVSQDTILGINYIQIYYINQLKNISNLEI